MGSAVSINANILGVDNNWSYLLCSPATAIAIDCSKATVMGEWWFEPYLCITNGVCYTKHSSSQSSSSIRGVEVKMENGTSYYLNGTLTDYTAKCNACCGSTPSLTPIAIPAWIPCEDICADEDGNYIFTNYVPTLGATQTYTYSIYVNGAAGAPATSSAVASPAALLAYAIANWAAYGTWTLVGNTLILTSTTTTCLALVTALEENTFCIEPTFPLTFDEVTYSGDNGVTSSFMLPNGAEVAADEDALGVILAGYGIFASATYSSPIAAKLQLVTTGNPLLIKNAGATVGTWTVGACA